MVLINAWVTGPSHLQKSWNSAQWPWSYWAGRTHSACSGLSLVLPDVNPFLFATYRQAAAFCSQSLSIHGLLIWGWSGRKETSGKNDLSWQEALSELRNQGLHIYNSISAFYGLQIVFPTGPCCQQKKGLNSHTGLYLLIHKYLLHTRKHTSPEIRLHLQLFSKLSALSCSLQAGALWVPSNGNSQSRPANIPMRPPDTKSTVTSSLAPCSCGCCVSDISEPSVSRQSSILPAHGVSVLLTLMS